jgi:hypothetical protein
VCFPIELKWWNRYGAVKSHLGVQAPSLPVPGKWSFCKVRRTFRPEDFNYRDPGTVKAVKAWEEAIWKRKKWMSFDEWADEYEWKHRPDDY